MDESSGNNRAQSSGEVRLPGKERRKVKGEPVVKRLRRRRSNMFIKMSRVLHQGNEQITIKISNMVILQQWIEHG